MIAQPEIAAPTAAEWQQTPSAGADTTATTVSAAVPGFMRTSVVGNVFFVSEHNR
jgi:hypothetical protein